MIFMWVLKNKLLANQLIWWYFYEFNAMLTILEYKVERLKVFNIIKRTTMWFKFYKFFSKTPIGVLEITEYTKLAGLLFSFKEFLHHSICRLYTFFLLLNSLYIKFSKFWVWPKLVVFTNIFILKTTSVFSWKKVFNSQTGSSVDFLNSFSYIYTISAKNKSWVYYNTPMHTPQFFYNINIFNVKQIWKNAIKINIIKFCNNINKFNNFKIIKFNLLNFVVIFFLLFSIFKEFFYYNLFNHIWFNITLLFFFYFLISTYFHFSKTYNTNKYTNQTQRFWKRTFGVFWGLEFTLFIIYMYLTLISPSELPMYAINYKEIITGINIVKNSQYHMFYIIMLVVLNIFFQILFFLKKKNNFHLFNFILFFINLIFCYILYYEFLKLYYSAGWGTHSVYNFNKIQLNSFDYNNLNTNTIDLDANTSWYFKVPNSLNNGWNEFSNEKQWIRTFRHFIYIMVILKFWHIFFIYTYFALSLIKFVETNYWSFDTLSSNYQNILYIIWFYLFSYLLILKKKLYFFITFVYYWSFVEISFTNIIQSFFFEMNLFYLF